MRTSGSIARRAASARTLVLLGATLAAGVPARARAQAASTEAPAAAATGALRVARVFGDGVVLQRGAPIPVWGWGAPGARVTVTLGGRTAHAVVDASGRWRATLPARPAGGPLTLGVASGDARLAVRDVLVGDVWVAAGQSNMEWPLAMAQHGAEDVAAANDPRLRQFKVPVAWAERPADDVAGGAWTPADPAHAGAFSAVAYHTARELRRSPALRDVPIGIVNASWGGSAIETWLAPAAQGLGPDGPARALAAERARLDSVGAALRARLPDLPARDPGATTGPGSWAAPELDDAAWTPLRVPRDWESQGLAGLDGVVWYRTAFTLTAEEAAQGARLLLGRVDDDDVTWVNGVEVGRTTGYMAERAYAVPAGVLRAGRNVLAVRVVDHGGGGGIVGAPTPPRLALAAGTRPLAEGWRARVGAVTANMDGQRLNKVPALAYHAMVHPLLPFPVRGVLWYQGESNANGPEQAAAYRASFASLVRSWRGAWGRGAPGALPFLWVQLPNFGRPDTVPVARPGWAVLRESMTAALALPRTGQAITIDVGEADDIHPRNKRDVGHRLGLVARRVAYGEAVLASGPTYRAHRVADGRVTLTFDHVGGGLAVRGTAGATGATTALDGTDGAPVGGFTIAGADGRFVRAEARLAGRGVVVWSDRVPRPVAVRYAWADNPADATLYNRDGLPAAPFRTDAR